MVNRNFTLINGDIEDVHAAILSIFKKWNHTIIKDCQIPIKIPIEEEIPYETPIRYLILWHPTNADGVVLFGNQFDGFYSMTYLLNHDYNFELTRIAVDFDIENNEPEYGMFHSFHHFYADGRERLVRVMWDDRWDFYEKGEPMPFEQTERYTERLLNALQKELRLDRQPRHIECFDNSNLQGAHPVASCVVFRDGKPARKEYRHFNIKTVEGPDDYASMREVVFRRYSRLQEEGAELPDLIIADGGKGQMGIIHEVLEYLGLDIPVAGLAKNDRHRTSELLCGYPPVLVGIRPTSPLFHFLAHIQEEVHRFAVSFHRQKRSKAFIHSELEQIEGVGDKTVQTLSLIHI